MSNSLNILVKNMCALRQRIQKLKYSLDKNSPVFPLDFEGLEDLDDEREESIDALILRYSQCVSMIQDQIFRGITYQEQEETGEKSNRDRTMLMEKLGAIRSAEEFGTAALLRNKFSHHYPLDLKQQLEKLNIIVDEAENVVETYNDVVSYLIRKGFIQPGDIEKV